MFDRNNKCHTKPFRMTIILRLLHPKSKNDGQLFSHPARVSSLCLGNIYTILILFLCAQNKALGLFGLCSCWKFFLSETDPFSYLLIALESLAIDISGTERNFDLLPLLDTLKHLFFSLIFYRISHSEAWLDYR